MNLNNINVNKYPVSQLFDPDSKVVFKIPKYQREYTWGDKEWGALFDDLTENSEGYFLGALICINNAGSFINEPVFEVIDGQQRLTTLSLLMVALYSKLTEFRGKGLLQEEDQEADILQLKRKLILKNTDSSIRIIPQSQNNNKEDYLRLLSSLNIIDPNRVKFCSPDSFKDRNIYKAYSFFSMRIDEALKDNNNAVTDIFNLLDKLNSAILVMIEVSSHADAYTLFSSLNGRGTPLTAVDLIKNLLLSRLDPIYKANDNYAFNSWQCILKNLGDDYAVQERFFRHNYNAFRKNLNAPFATEDRPYPVGIIATKSLMLDIYNKLIDRNAVGMLNVFLDNSAIYAKLLLNNTENLTEEQIDCYTDLEKTQAAAAYLPVMYMIKYKDVLKLNDQDIIRICRLLISFFVRRNITDTPSTRFLERMFMSFIEKIENEHYTGDAIYDNLRNNLIQVSASDEFFEEKLRGPVFKDNKNMTRFLLGMLAKSGMTAESKQDLWGQKSNKYQWSIEHIFPQGENIPKEWVDMIADGDPVKAKEYQEKYVHTLGNLTLTKFNSKLSNKPFEYKKYCKDRENNPIGYMNNLSLNKDVCDKETWTVEIIQERTDRMVRKLMQMFAL